MNRVFVVYGITAAAVSAILLGIGLYGYLRKRNQPSDLSMDEVDFDDFDETWTEYDLAMLGILKGQDDGLR